MWVIVETVGDRVESARIAKSEKEAIQEAADFAELCGQDRKGALEDLKDHRYTEEGECRITVLQAT